VSHRMQAQAVNDRHSACALRIGNACFQKTPDDKLCSKQCVAQLGQLLACDRRSTYC
jgi:hypothetical protein